MKKLILFVVIISIWLPESYGVVAYPHPVKITQPDGTVVTVLLKGDEHVRWAETIDGYSLLRNKKGAWEYAKTDAQGDLVCSGILAKEINQRSSADNTFLQKVQKKQKFSKSQVRILKQVAHFKSAQAVEAFPKSGTINNLMILIEFQDLAFSRSKTDFENLMNQVNYNGIGSFRDFYFENSYGELTINTTVAGIYTAANNMAYYGTNVPWDDYRVGELITEAVTMADNDVDFSDFDNNGDGVVDGVYVIYAGYGEEAGTSTNAIWAHASSIDPQTLDNVQVRKYACSCELRGNAQDNSNDKITAIGIICHEFGHSLGAPDYYDTDYETNGDYPGTGGWDVMASGSWNDDGDTPSHHNPYTKINVYNWATVTTISNIQQVLLRDATTYPDFVQINTPTSNEYFLCENRQWNGFNYWLQGHGMLIYHVDGDYTDNHFDDNDINNREHQGVYIVSASATTANGVMENGDIDLDDCPWPGTGNKTTFDDTTTPNSKSWAGENTNKAILNISEDNGEISFCLISCDENVPANLTATAISSSQIDLDWDLNTYSDPVILAFNTTSDLGTPLDGASYSTGDPIPGGGTVIYKGTGTSFNHALLSPNTTYYYKVWSVVGENTYSGGIAAEEKTWCSTYTLPFMEDFETTNFPPACWESFRGTNNLGVSNDWTRTTSGNNASSGAAFVNYEDVLGGTAEDWLVTPGIVLPSIGAVTLSYYQKQDFGTDYGSSYSIKISTSSQTDHSSFTDVFTYSESDFGTEYSQISVDLSAYLGNTVYIAFVMETDDGDSWYIDNVIVEGTGVLTVNDDTDVTNEDTAVTTPVLDNDTDVDGVIDPSTVTLVTSPSNGTASINPVTGEITYTPEANYNGPDSYVYSVCDDNGDCGQATVTITVNDVNDAPVANDDTDVTNEDTAVTIPVLANDTDVDGVIDPSTVTLVTSPSNGTASIDPVTGEITYTPEANYNGPDSYVYSVCDDDGDCGQATVTITVSDVNDAPGQGNEIAATDEDTPINTPNVLANNADVDGTVSVSTTSGSTPQGGGFTYNLSDSTFSYIPATDFFGNDTIFYEVCDNDGSCVQDSVFITVNDINDAPVANDDTDVTNEDTAVTTPVLANDTDVDGVIDPTTVTLVTTPSNGTASIDPVTGEITYTPEANYNGPDSYVYSVCDDDGDCGQATVTITVSDVNNAPGQGNEIAATDEDTPINTPNVLANNTDVDGTVSVSTTSGSTPQGGGFTYNLADSTFSYIPSTDFFGNDTIFYEVCDNDGSCVQDSVFITVNDVNDAPVANNDSDFTNEDTPVITSVLANDTDVDGVIDPSTVTLVTSPSNGTASVDPVTGEITYTPDAVYNGPDSYVYSVCDDDGDCSQATVTITVSDVNNAPVANDDTDVTNEDTAVTTPVLANDTDVDGVIDPTTVTLVTTPSNGTASIDPVTGEITYTPEANYNGPDSYVYSVCDDDGDCGQATVTITVNDVNDAPVANGDTDITNEDTAVTTPVLANDTDVDGVIDPSTVTLVTAPSNGTVSIDQATGEITYTPDANYNGPDSYVYSVCDDDGDCSQATVTITVSDVNNAPVANDDSDVTNEDTAVTTPVLANDTDVDGVIDPSTVTLVTSPSNGTASIDPVTGEITYTPEANYNGPDSYVYSVCDDDGDCAQATVTITVNDVNDAPVANDDSDVTNEDTPVTTPVLANDTDVDGVIDPTTVTLVTAPSNGTVSIDQATGEITYTPDANYNGPDSYVYSVCDDDGDCAQATVTITVIAVNDTPVADAGIAQTVDEGEFVLLDGTGSFDPDGDELTYQWTSPSGIMLSSATSATPSFIAPKVTGDTTYFFSLTVNDSQVSSIPDTVAVTVMFSTSSPLISTSSLKLYPNPVSSLLTIDFGQNNIKEAQVSLYNDLGEKINHYILSGVKGNIDMSNFTSGPYMVNIRIGHNTYSHLIIKK